MSKANETRHIEWHETCKCKCRLDSSVCNSKQRWNEGRQIPIYRKVPGSIK